MKKADLIGKDATVKVKNNIIPISSEVIVDTVDLSSYDEKFGMVMND